MQNPFRPSFGVPPLFWVGRATILDSFRSALATGPGAFGRSMVISGARGIGKTVLLNELEDIATANGWLALRASGRMNLTRELRDTTIPRAAASLNPPQKRRVSRVGISSLGTVGFEHDDEPDFQPTLNTELRRLVGLTSESGVLITIDEVQDASQDDLTELAVAYQDLLRDELNVALVMAGLPQGVEGLLDLPGATFLRRAERHLLGPFSPPNSATAFHSTAAESGIAFTDDAVAAATELSQGYPFLVQLVGSLAWQKAHADSRDAITTADVEAVTDTAIATMGSQVHAPAVRDLPPAQRAYLEAMAHVGGGGIAASAIAEQVGKPVKSLSDTRQKLIGADLIEPAGFGKVAFTLPYLAEYLRSTDRLGRVD